jgi:hypothetical protein
LSNVKNFIQIIVNGALGNFSSFGFSALALVKAKPNVLKCAAGFFGMKHNGLAMRSAGLNTTTLSACLYVC